MGLLDDINAQAQAQASKSGTFIPPLMNDESDGSGVTSQILNADNAAQVNQRISGQGSSNTGIPWYFDNRNLRPDRLFIINPDPSTLNTPQDSNAGSSSPDMRDASQFNFTANDLLNMRFDKTIPKQGYHVANPYQFNPSDLQNYDPKASPLDYYNTSEFDNYNVYNFANNKYDKAGLQNYTIIDTEKFNPYPPHISETDPLLEATPKKTKDPFNINVNTVVNDKNIAYGNAEVQSAQSILEQNRKNEKIARDLYNHWKKECFNKCIHNNYGESYEIAKELSPLSVLGMTQNVYNDVTLGMAEHEIKALPTKAARTKGDVLVKIAEANKAAKTLGRLKPMTKALGRFNTASEIVGAACAGYALGAYGYCSLDCAFEEDEYEKNNP